MRRFALVYQCGIANVFECLPEGRKRVYQGSYQQGEDICRGILLAGVSVHVYHCDLAGDCDLQPWQTGRGELFGRSKRPPHGATE